jgi:hypothetical protein
MKQIRSSDGCTGHSGDHSHANATAESEPEETISIEESDVVIEPIQPIVPEDQKATL